MLTDASGLFLALLGVLLCNFESERQHMNDFATEDISNIALLCFLLGIGFITFIGVAAIYITSLFLMESFNDRD
jgi:hypothetical protein